MIAFAIFYLPFFIIGGLIWNWSDAGKVYGIAVAISTVAYGLRAYMIKKATGEWPRE